MKLRTVPIFIIFIFLIQHGHSQTPCTGSAGTISLTSTNLSASPSEVTLNWTHSIGPSGSWGQWSDQPSYKLSGSSSYINSGSTITGLVPGMMYDFKVIGTRFAGRKGRRV